MSTDAIKRRQFLQFIGRTYATAGIASLGLTSACSSTKQGGSPLPIRPIQPSKMDKLVLAAGLNYQLLIKEGDPLGKGQNFGANNDFTAFFPFPQSSTQALLWVNHEAVNPVLLHGKDKKSLNRNRAEISKEQKSVGGSIIHLKKHEQDWHFVKGSKYNRRIDGQTPIPFTKGTKIMGSSRAIGTIANCAGGTTPWATVLTSEENYHLSYGDNIYDNGNKTFNPESAWEWYKQFPYPPEHYGWVTEVNPWTGAAKKHVPLGRASHEGATCILTKNQRRVVVYMGEDRTGGYLFKFISDTPNSFDNGTLYAADTKNGKWLPLDIKKNPKLKKHFANQLDVLIYSRYAAMYAGATPQDRPEDIEVDPKTGEVLITLTNNKTTNNHFGGILKLKEDKDYDSLEFSSDIFLAGGSKSGFSCPDNIAFDSKGNLWLTVDMSEKKMHKGVYKSFKNNGLFYIPLSGNHSGTAFQVASAPTGAELTGPQFSPDYKTLFLSVQHPGGGTKDPANPTSRWPSGKGLPKSAVVAITGNSLLKLTQ